MGERGTRQDDVTRLLQAWSAGRDGAFDQLFAIVYNELLKIARGQLARARRGHTFQPTDLVHEAYVRLVAQRVTWRSRLHFYGIASMCMRRVLADYARRKKTAKRPQVDPGVDVSGIEQSNTTDVDTLVAIDEVFERLESTKPRQARVAELRVFGGLGDREIASLVGISTATVKRDWESAQEVLTEALKEPRDSR